MDIVFNEPEAARHALQSAVLLYGTSEHAIAMHHEVIVEKTGARLGPGTFVTTSFIEKLLAGLSTSDLTYVEPHVIAISRNAIAWYEPAGPHAMHFATNDPAVDAFNLIEIPLPALVFIATRRSLSVFALSNNERPTLTTDLYEAPFYNCFSDGQMCLGSMHRPNTFTAESTKQWKQSFFLSAFTHLSAGKRWRTDGTYAELLAAAQRRGSFDPAWLKPTSQTIQGAIRSCGHSQRAT